MSRPDTCDGLRWSDQTAGGYTRRVYSHDCPKRRECAAFRRWQKVRDPDDCPSVNAPEVGRECSQFEPVTKS
jgi:hypothetical protein